MSLFSELGSSNIEAHKHANEFRNTFRIGLTEFWDPIFGFNIVHFDEWLKVPKGQSCSEYLKEKHGEKAQRLIQILIRL